jgi:hypothetical protein
MRSGSRRLLVLLTMVLVLAGCSKDLDLAGKNETAISAESAKAAGVEWPYTVPDGFIYCVRPGDQNTAELFRPRGSESLYAINDWAKINNREPYEVSTDLMKPEFRYVNSHKLDSFYSLVDRIFGVSAR